MTSEVHEAAEAMRAGEVIAYPTEAVWGLGCDPDNAQALQRILELKRRDPSKGLIMIAASIEQLAPWLEGLDEQALALLRDTWPAPLTWLVPDNGRAHPLVRGDHHKVALRVTNHPLVIQLCEAFGGPIISTSANRASESSALTAKEVHDAFGEEVPLILEGDTGGRTKPSDIRDLETGEWLRN